ncbi:hypothetical protein BS47DRAFT_1393771 [Hydnum rufescens UP504]|uniref:RRM domain-containing protein n=1 Tax=Hydnum rufescens UP504 TaxID=1448309 RepID=A0A9P6DT62_9AGAM|nr:hypothetical protein BS47DRAFT_1393771 [Hydnum rufescens UP504]
MQSPESHHTNGNIDQTPDYKSRVHVSRSPGRDHHSSRSHRDGRDRERDSDRRRSDRDDRDDRREHHHSRRRSRSTERERDRDRDKDRDRDREDRHRERRSYDRDGARDRPRDSDRDHDRRRRKLDDMDESSPRSDERTNKRTRGNDDSLEVGSRPPRSDGGGDLTEKVSRTSGRDHSRDSDRRSYTRRSDDGGPRRPPPGDMLPVDDRSPPHTRLPYPDDRHDRRVRSPPVRRRPSPSYDAPPVPPEDDDSEARSVFVSQLAARMTAKDLGYFFEEKLGVGSVRDPRIVTDRLSRRSKGIAYVELSSIDLVQKAIELSGTVVMGLPIKVQLTESERNKQPSTSESLLGSGLMSQSGAMQLYVGSLHFNLTEADIKQVFEPFGELEFVDLHRDPATGRSKGYAFVQFKRSEDAKMALEQMEGFELAGRQLRVNTVHEKGTAKGIQPQDSLDENGGSLNNNSSRHMLMQKLARTDVPAPRPAAIMRPNIPQVQTRSILLKNMFDPAEETEQDWDKELAEDVKGECASKYGPVVNIKVIRESQGEIYVQFDTVESSAKAYGGLNGRWFGGKLVSASYISDAIMQAQT